MDQVSLYQQRKEAGLCTRCGKPAAEDSDLCAPHAADARKRKRTHIAKRRAEWKRKKRCSSCGRKRNGKSRLCDRCLIRLGKLKEGASRGVDRYVDKQQRIRAATIVDKDGRSRYLGKRKRGAPSSDELIAECFEQARKELDAAVDGFAHYLKQKAAGLPRIQLGDLKSAAIGRAFASARELLDACQTDGWTIPGLNEDEGEEDAASSQIAASPRKERG